MAISARYVDPVELGHRLCVHGCVLGILHDRPGGRMCPTWPHIEVDFVPLSPLPVAIARYRVRVRV